MIKRMMALALLALLAAPRAQAETLAKVGSDAVSRDEFETKASAEAAKLKRALTHDERVSLMRSLLNQRLLVAEARRRKLDRRDDYRATVEEIERKMLADQVYQEEVADKVNVTLADAKEFYTQNPGLFDMAEVGQVLVAGAGGEKKAKDLKAALLKAPKTFAAVAKASSDDAASKPRGGDLGTLRRGMLLPELEQAVFGAKSGSIVGPVATQFGWHILQVRSVKRLTWEQAGEGLQKELQRLRTLQLQQALLDGLAKKDKVTLDEAKL
jgi:peptidyl-prolyl cis-trans isomerase C